MLGGLGVVSVAWVYQELRAIRERADNAGEAR